MRLRDDRNEIPRRILIPMHEPLIRNVVLGTNYEDSRGQDQKIAVPVRNSVREVPLNCG